LNISALLFIGYLEPLAKLQWRAELSAVVEISKSAPEFR
jgi:hypothetical protein